MVRFSFIIGLTLLASCSPRYGIFQYDNGDDYCVEGMRRIVDKNGKVGYSDCNGKVIVKPQFVHGFPYENGVAKVTLVGKKSQPDWDGHWAVLNGDWFYIDKQGNIVSPTE